MSSFIFEATLDSASTLRKIVEAIKELVKEVNLQVDESGVSIQAMDNSHVALVSANIDAGGFSSFKCSKPITLGVNLEQLIKVMKLAGESDSVSLKADEAGDKLYLTFENYKAARKVDFMLNLLSIESEAFSIPEQDYDAMVTMDAVECAKLFRELYQLAETAAIEASHGKITFWSEGEAGKSKTVLSEKGSTKVDVKHQIKQSYAMRYLNVFNKAAPCSSEVKIVLSDTAPIIVNYDLGALGEIKYYLAPKKAAEEGKAKKEEE